MPQQRWRLKTATKKTVTTTKKPAARKPATTKNKKLGKGLDAIFGGDISTLIDDIEKIHLNQNR